jgi:hypothetical protein
LSTISWYYLLSSCPEDIMRCCNRRSKTTGLIVDPQDSLVYGDRPPHLSGRHKEGREAVNSFFHRSPRYPGEI